jgi:hypothetical protein
MIQEVWSTALVASLLEHLPQFVAMMTVAVAIGGLAHRGLSILALLPRVSVGQVGLLASTIGVALYLPLMLMAWLASTAVADAYDSVYAYVFFMG